MQTYPANTDFRTLIGLLQEKATEAAALRKQLGEFRTQIAELTDTEIRTPAQAALERANKAIAEGRLGDPDREPETLELLRRTETEQTTKAWESGIEARAGLAGLHLDFDKASAIRIAAADTERLHSLLRQWRLLFGATESLYDKASRFRDRAALMRALELFRDRILPLVPKERQPESWVQTQNSLGIALLKLSDFDDDDAVLEQAAEVFRGTFDVYLRDRL